MKTRKSTLRKDLHGTARLLKNLEESARFWFERRHNGSPETYAACRKKFLKARRNVQFFRRILERQTRFYLSEYKC